MPPAPCDHRLQVRAVVLAVLMTASACGNDEVVTDAPVAPADAADGGVADPDGSPIDADLRCSACGPTQVCVAFHNGTCSNTLVECQDRHPLCEGLNCLQDRDCEFWHCRGGMDAGTPYTCYACPNDLPAAINCHGP